MFRHDGTKRRRRTTKGRIRRDDERRWRKIQAGKHANINDEPELSSATSDDALPEKSKKKSKHKKRGDEQRAHRRPRQIHTYVTTTKNTATAILEHLRQIHVTPGRMPRLR